MPPDYHAAIFLVIGGGLGGFIAAIRSNSTNRIAIPFLKKPCALGFLGDVIIGCCASVVAYAVLGVIPGAEVIKTASALDTLRLGGFGIASGFAGIKVLERASFDLLRRQQEELDRTIRLNALIAEAERYYGQKLYPLAVESFEKALVLDPYSLEAKMGLAISKSFMGMGEEAIKLLTEIVSVNSQSARAFYNRACIKADINNTAPTYTLDEILSDLHRAIALSEIWRAVAQADPDFYAIRDNPKFQELMRGARTREWAREPSQIRVGPSEHLDSSEEILE